MTDEAEIPYYLADNPNYTFIENYNIIVASDVAKCSPFKMNATQFKIKIENEYYPKILPLYYNNSINFRCLNESKVVKKILLWNKFRGEPIDNIYDGIMQGTIFQNCPISNCEVSLDRTQVNSSDYILFHMRR